MLFFVLQNDSHGVKRFPWADILSSLPSSQTSRNDQLELFTSLFIQHDQSSDPSVFTLERGAQRQTQMLNILLLALCKPADLTSSRQPLVSNQLCDRQASLNTTRGRHFETPLHHFNITTWQYVKFGGRLSAACKRKPKAAWMTDNINTHLVFGKWGIIFGSTG